ncbi:putative transcription factor Nin-like family [Lupinus albus]|uniref:Putative transcription factor Nin-like family n=1 Tax=Lupinus albus TaxID=3870 RepID=A0A6A4PR61_LUPAL|nr:putative transcription factor Nin-like family [Lupinus albus]
MDISQCDDFFDFSYVPQFSHQSNQLFFNGLPELENLNFEEDFDLLPKDENFGVEQKPLHMVVAQPPPPHGFGDLALMNCVKKEVDKNNEGMLLLPNTNSSSNIKKRSSALEFDEIKKHFGVPISEAAKEMNVGLTLLKRRCRELNIMRWPHRKLKSLELLIRNVKEMGLSEEIARLEQHRKMLEKQPHLELTEETKKLRQTCFKANYKKRRCFSLQY